jgi:hypothetical protein
MSDEFANTNIDKECCCDKDESVDVHSNNDPFQNQITGRDIIQLKNSIIPRGLVPLEKMFDENDVAKNPNITASEEDVEDFNIENKENSKMVKLSKTLSLEVKQDYVKLMKDFLDVFTWSYDDLKLYEKNVIQHVIPLKEYHKPFKQKMRQINPLFSPLIEKEINNLFDAKIIMSL